MVLSRSQILEYEELILQAFKKDSFVANISSSIGAIIEKQMSVLMEKLIERYEVKFSEFKTQIDALKSENLSLKKECENKVDALEQYSRKNNLRIYGLPEDVNEDVEAVVASTLSTKLNMDVNPAFIEVCHRLGQRSNSTIIIKFSSHKYKSLVYRHRSRLKGTKIVIKEDLTRKRDEAMKNLVTKYGRKNVWSVDGVLFFREDGSVHKFK
ncbi:l1 transposable element-related [Holotrichia oblita]|uniref:L1 transposable element-related n=1 Tax=Holotrichia oblita TaxID=644536 RepID=A0ACB9SYA0_HOLOL|nr:l1 transposable element-related [Holotrichia oblita]